MKWYNDYTINVILIVVLLISIFVDIYTYVN